MKKKFFYAKKEFSSSIKKGCAAVVKAFYEKGFLFAMNEFFKQISIKKFCIAAKNGYIYL
jgi:hypothetical protein